MQIAPDGSPVQLYQRLPARVAEASLIHRLLPRGGTVLDLGCGTGRLAEPLAELGHPVTGVDNEPRMLANLRRATGMAADIAALDLGTRFDAVLLMSHFVDGADDPEVVTLLRAVRRHVKDSASGDVTGSGFAVVERHPPGWASTCTESSSVTDGIAYTLTNLVRDSGVLTATIRYEFGGHRAEQRFSIRDTDDERLSELAAAAALRFDSHLDPAGTLVRLDPVVLTPW